MGLDEIAEAIHCSTVMPRRPDNHTLLTWGPLTIVERIGSGTFGEVYRATDPRLNSARRPG